MRALLHRGLLLPLLVCFGLVFGYLALILVIGYFMSRSGPA